MRRRDFITLLGTAATAWPVGARAQQLSTKVARIGLLMPVSAASAAQNVAALRRGLRELGYVEGQNIGIEQRYTDGRDELLPELAAELVKLDVDIIVTWGTGSTRAAKQATTTKPIVMAAIADPIGTGIVTSIARPGQNVTGLSSTSLDIDAKRLEMLRQLVPTAKRIGALWNPANPVSALILKQTKAAADTLGLELVPVAAHVADEFAEAFATLAQARLDALTVQTEVVLLDRKIPILEFAAKQRLPATYGFRDFVDAGGLMFYGPSWLDLFRRAATYIDKILKGAKPGDLPIEQPTKFELILNLKTARELGLSIPQTLLATADEVIE
jgi:putative ABC transport system substrate-binding protein